MVEKGIKITEVKLSNKKNGYELFTEDELAALSEILGVSLEK